MLNIKNLLSFSYLILFLFCNGLALAGGVEDTGQAPPDTFPESDQIESYAEKSKRFYFSLRYGRSVLMENDIAPGFEIDSNVGHELVATQIGFDFSKYISLELAGEGYEMDINASGFGKVVEYSSYHLIPQIKLRYPMQNGRLSPYLIGGIGIGFTEANDRTPLGEGLPAVFGPPTSSDPAIPNFDGSDTSMVYSIGAGAEYFVADNFAVGLETKYVFHSANISIDGLEHEVDLDAFFISAGVRFLFPGPPRPSSAYSTAAGGDFFYIDHDTLAPYFGIRVGTARFAEEQLTPNFVFSDNEREQVVNLTLGLELNRYLAIELAVDHFGNDVNVSNAGMTAKVAEINLISAVPQLRVQYPFLDDKLLPYVIAGIGFGLVQSNDQTSLGASNRVPLFNADDYSVVSVMGTGLDYYIADNMTIGIEAKYLFNNPDITIDQIPVETEMDRVIFTAGLRVFF